MKEIKLQHCEHYSNKYDFEHTITEKENEYEITFKMTIKKGEKEEKFAIDCIENQKSPITQILGKLERKYERDKKHGETVISIY